MSIKVLFYYLSLYILQVHCESLFEYIHTYVHIYVFIVQLQIMTNFFKVVVGTTFFWDRRGELKSHSLKSELSIFIRQNQRICTEPTGWILHFHPLNLKISKIIGGPNLDDDF